MQHKNKSTRIHCRIHSEIHLEKLAPIAWRRNLRTEICVFICVFTLVLIWLFIFSTGTKIHVALLLNRHGEG